MLKFHYMWRGKPLSALELRELSVQLEDVGYESVLLTFHSECPDYLIKSAAALVPGHKLKYMIALRPYHVSAQYCAMITEGFSQIDKNRLIFNWIAGDQHNRKDEKPNKTTYNDTESIDTIEKRKEFLREFVSDFIKYEVLTDIPDMVFSGYSEFTVVTANMFNSPTLSMLDDYRRNKKLLSINNKNMISITVIVCKDEEIETIKDKLKIVQERSLDFTIIGTQEKIKQEILSLEHEGITDVLINTEYPYHPEFKGYSSDKNMINVNNMIKEVIKSV